MYTVLINGVVAHDPSLNNPSRVLADCVVTKKVNTADSFTFTIYPDNAAYDLIDLSHEIFVEVRKDSTNLFYGRILKEDTGWDNEKKITCEGALAFLNDSIIRPYEYQGDVLPYLRFLINSHNSQMNGTKQFTIRNVTVTDPNNNIVRSNSDYTPTITELLNKTSGSDLGGYLVVEYSDAHIYLDYLVNSTNGTSQTIALGSNLVDFQRSISSEAMATGVIPLGAKNEEGTRLTVASVNDGKDYVLDSTAVTNKGIIYTTCVFDDITTPAYLLARARGYLSDLTRIVPRIELNAVDLTLAGYAMEDIGFFEYVTVEDTVHGVNGQYLITERTWNLSSPENDKVTFGGADKTISGQSSKNQNAITLASEAVLNQARSIIDYQTELLKGGSGGYFVIGSDEDGHPSEIYFLDTDDRTTARSVLRINKNGIGFSTTGFNGPYTNAWTIDGRLNASYITTGILKDAATNGQKFSFNLETGEMYLDALDILVGGLYVGGRNLIVNTLNPVASPATNRPHILGQTSSTVGSSGVTEAEHGLKVVGATRPYIRFGAGSGSMNGLVSGQTYTFSADVSWKVLTNYTGTTKYQIRSAIYGNKTGSMTTEDYVDIESDCTTNKTGTAKCRFTFTPSTTTTEVYLYVYCNNTTASSYDTTDYLEVANMKLEYGEVATAWSPAYEDLNEYAEETAHSQILAHDDEIYLEVSRVYEKIEDAAVVNMMPSIYSREYTDGKEYVSPAGITWTVNDDGSVTAKGTASSAAWYSLTRSDGVITGSVPPIKIDPDKKYTLSGCPAGSSASTYRMFYRLYTDDTTYGSWIVINDKTTFGPNSKYVEIGIQIYANYTCPEEGVTFYPMLEPGTIAHGYISPRNGTGAIGNLAKTNKASIDLQSNKIALVVEEKNGQNVIKSASIVTAINNDSSVTINADRINLQGAVTISSLSNDVKTELDKGQSALDAAAAAQVTANTANGKAVAFRGICSTVATTAAKTVTSGNFTGLDLVQGATVTVYNGTANTKADSALTLNVNGTGAKQIYINNAVTSSTNQLLWTANSSITYTYDGTHWRVEDKPGVWYGSTCSIAAATAAKTTTVNEAVIFKGATVYVPMTYENTSDSATMNVSSLGAKNIYYGTTTTRPTTANAHGWIAGKSVALTFDGAYWRLSEGATYIDGGHIITGTIDASKATITNINASNITSGTISADRIAAGSLSISAFNDLNVGGRNYAWAVSSDYHSGTTLSKVTSTYDPNKNGEYVVTATAAGASDQNSPQTYTKQYAIPPELIGTDCLFHADAIERSNSATNPQVGVLLYNSSGTGIINQYIQIGTLSKVISIPSNAATMRIAIFVDSNKVNAVGDRATIRGVKLEKGTVATDWSPAPEDQEEATDKADAKAQSALDNSAIINLLPSIYLTEANSNGPVTRNGITWTVNNDGSVTAKGTATANSDFWLCDNEISSTTAVPLINIDPNSYYVYSHGTTGGDYTTSYSMQVNTLNSSGTSLGNRAIADKGTSTFPTKLKFTGQAYVSVKLRIASGYACPSDGITFYPMMERGSVAHDYVSSRNGTAGLLQRSNYRERIIYASKASGTTSLAAPTSWISDETGGQNKWTLKRPQYSKTYPVCFVATQRQNAAGTFSCTTPMIDDTTTVIDGGHIITHSITADQLAANSVTADKISVTDLSAVGATIGGWNIGSNKIYKSLSGSTMTTEVAMNSPASPTTSDLAFYVSKTIGGATAYPFSVSYGGKLTATDADITGKITASDGQIGRYEITSTYLKAYGTEGDNTTCVGIGGNQAFWAGSNDSNNAPFRVSYDGDLVAKSGTIGGWTVGADSLSKATAAGVSGTASTQGEAFLQGFNSDPGTGNNAIIVRTRPWDGSAYGSWTTQFSVTYGGALTAKSGNIAGWKIDPGGFTKATAAGVAGTASTQYETWIQALSGTPTSGSNAIIVRQREWDGSAYGSWTNNFRVTYAGYVYANNAEIFGKIHATGGDISGWTIGATDFSKTATVQSGNTYTQYQIYFQANASPTGTTNAINVRTRSKEGADASYGSWTQKFTVTYNGKMVANDADITGKITASDGYIGRFRITSTSLYATGTQGDNSTMAGMGGNQAFWAGSDSSSSAPFRVSYSGKIIATDAEISGKITATSGSISGSLVTSGISASNVTAGTLSADRLDISGLFAKYIEASNFNITGGSFSVSASKGTNKLTLTDTDGAYTKIYTGMLDLKYVTNASESVEGGRTLISGNGISFYNASGTAKGSINQDGSINGLYATSLSNPYGNLANTGASLTASANSVSTSSGTVKALTKVTLPYGKWVVVGTATFPTNSSGYRKISVSTTSASVGSGFVQTTPGSTGSVQTVLTTCGIFTVTASTVVYLNTMQNSTTSLSVSGSITAIRII